MKRIALLAAAVLVLAGCSTPKEADPGIQDRANAFATKVQSDITAEAKAADDAQKVLVTFPKDHPLRVLFAGDSLTSGYFASVEAKGYSQLVSADLSKHGAIELTRGQKAGGNLSTVGNLVDVPADLDLAIVELGTNDTQGRTAPATFASQYEALLTKITSTSANAKLICVGTWGAPGSDTDAYDKAIQTSCESRGGKYVDLSDTFMSQTNRGPAGVQTWAGSSDNFHPNDTGHQVIAGLVESRIRYS